VVPTTVDPVEQALAQYEEAQRAADQARADLESFKNEILSGNEDVSAEDYATAAHASEHADLKKDAAALALDAARARARLTQLEAIKAEIVEETGTPEEALADWRALAEIAGRIAARCHARQRNINLRMGQLRREGVPRVGMTETTSPEHGGLGWAEASMGQSDTITVDKRRIQALEPGMLIAAAVLAGARTHGITYLRLNGNKALESDPEAWFMSRY
jgi:hypothetical protein